VKASLAISAILHALFVAAIIVPAYQGRDADSGEIISVSLLGGGAAGGPAGAPAAEAAPAKVDKAPEEAKPTNSKMAYKPADKGKKSKATTAKPTSKTTKSGSAKSTGSAAGTASSKGTGSGRGGTGTGSGSGPGGGGITVDSQDFRFAYYLEVLRERISYNWAPPPIFGVTSEVTATVYFKIARDGSITAEEVEKTSKHELFDRSAVRAVRLADPLPPLPAGFKGKWLGVHFEFQHTPGQDTRG